MSQVAYRITKNRFVSTALSGEGARLYGGRWNSIGTRMVYLAGTLSGATLELLVHTDDYSTIEGLYSSMLAHIPMKCIETIESRLLPPGWDAPMPIAATQIIGDQWTESMSSAVLEVPSVITTGEKNFLCNPLHPDFKKIRVEAARAFKIDPRI